MSTPLRIAIIGAGFSGIVTAIQLARHEADVKLEITILDQSEKFGRGVAYSPVAKELLLNVPAGKMSLFADKPDDFLNFCQSVQPETLPTSFVSRALFGDYLIDRLRTYVESNDSIILGKIVDHVISVEPDPTKASWRIETQQGLYLEFNHVVLATGYQNAKWPINVRQLDSGRAIDTWDFEKIEKLDPEKPVLIVGTSLTAIDTLFYLSERNPHQKIILLSRHGLMPHSHQPRASSPGSSQIDVFLKYTNPFLSQLMRRFRELIRYHAALGVDWRDVMDDLRSHFPKLWQSLSEIQKRRFLKYLATYWDIHRHRMPQAIAERIEALKARNNIQIIAGRLLLAEDDGSDVLVHYRGSSSGSRKTIRTSAIINCSGHSTNIKTTNNPLMQQMLEAGLIKPDANSLGLELSPAYEILNQSKEPMRGLWYIGPMLKAQYWEATAVPELRVHAQTLAKNIVERCRASRLDHNSEVLITI